MSQVLSKKNAALRALNWIQPDQVVGIGTGSTVNALIELLPSIRSKLHVTVSSSEESTRRLKTLGIPVVSLAEVDGIDVYIDGADEVNAHFQMIKGGGGALTREKILASASRRIVCIVDESKYVDVLGKFPLPVEVIPMAKSVVARALIKLGGQPVLREGFTTDNGNLILDVHHLSMLDPVALETAINQIPGVVCNGIFALRPADVLIIGHDKGAEVKERLQKI